MSYVTNVILTYSIMEDDDDDGTGIVEREVNPLLPEHAGELNRINGHEGGTKCFECGVYAAAFNHFSVDDLMEILRSVPWKEPHNVRVMIQDQDDDCFTIHKL